MMRPGRRPAEGELACSHPRGSRPHRFPSGAAGDAPRVRSGARGAQVGGGPRRGASPGPLGAISQPQPARRPACGLEWGSPSSRSLPLPPRGVNVRTRTSPWGFPAQHARRAAAYGGWTPRPETAPLWPRGPAHGPRLVPRL